MDERRGRQQLAQISNPALPSGSPQWAPDRNKIAFDSLSRDGWDLYVADAAERVPGKLVTNFSNVVRLSGHEMESGSISAPKNQAGWESIVVPLPGVIEGNTGWSANHEEKSTLKKLGSAGTPPEWKQKWTDYLA
jgi:hypothetical protein